MISKLSLLVLSLSLAPLSLAKVEIPRFLEINEGIYRSGRPNKDAMKWLKDKHKIKTIINLENSDYAVKNERKWAKELEIEFHSLPMSAMETPEDETVNSILDLLSNKDKHPILIHCKHGRDRTGMMVALHRVENENWEPETARDEMIELGFRTYFYKLDNYFKERTGLELIPISIAQP